MRLKQAPPDPGRSPGGSGRAEDLAAGEAALEEQDQAIRQGFGLAGTGGCRQRQEPVVQLALVGLGELAAGMGAMDSSLIRQKRSMRLARQAATSSSLEATTTRLRAKSC